MQMEKQNRGHQAPSLGHPTSSTSTRRVSYSDQGNVVRQRVCAEDGQEVMGREVGKAGKLWSSPRCALEEPRSPQQRFCGCPAGRRPAEKGWQDPEGGAPGWAGSPVCQGRAGPRETLARPRRMEFLCCLSGRWLPGRMWRRQTAALSPQTRRGL